MTKYISNYKNEVYYNQISNQVFEENLCSLKSLIDEEVSFIGSQEANPIAFQGPNINDYNLENIDQILDNIISMDNQLKNKNLLKEYDFASSFVAKYSKK